MINHKNINDSGMNGELKNCGASFGNGFINSHSIYQYDASRPFNDMDWGVEIFDVNSELFINSQTLSEANNPSSLDNKNQRDGNVPNVSEMEDA